MALERQHLPMNFIQKKKKKHLPMNLFTRRIIEADQNSPNFPYPDSSFLELNVQIAK